MHCDLDFLSCVAVAVWNGQYSPEFDASMTDFADEECDRAYLPVLRLFNDEEPKPSY